MDVGHRDLAVAQAAAYFPSAQIAPGMLWRIYPDSWLGLTRFENRGPPCTLLVFIDDATNTLMQLRFVESESTFSDFDALA